MRFPHLDTDSDFPKIDNVEVYKYDNNFDYERFNDVQMKITVCKVPWDMGEVHVGQRAISGLGNVVHFGSKEKRDEWFSNLPDSKCFRYETKYRNLHRDETLDIDIPFDVAAKYNYVAVEHMPMASADDLILNEDEAGLRWWGWFIRDVEMLSPNTTRLHILNDAFQTFIYDFAIDNVILERGHAPMFATSANQYLSNPIKNSKNLLAPDVNFGDTHICASTHEHIFNAGDMYALIISSANVFADFTERTPTAHFTVQGTPSYSAFAIDAHDINRLLNNADMYIPQFIQTIQAIAFVSKRITNVFGGFSFLGVSCHYVGDDYKQVNVHTFNKDDFGFEAQYRDIAKLYTYPYSYIVLSDGNGDNVEVRIENTDGRIDFAFKASMIFPWLNISAHMVSGGKERKTISFKTADSFTMPIGGNWYEIAMKWDIPTFGVLQDAGIHNDYATRYDRVQIGVEGENARASAYAAADTVLTNVNATQAGLLANNADAITNANTKIDTLLDGGSISQTGGSGGYLAATYAANLDKLSDDADADQILMIQQTGISQGGIAANGIMNAAGSIGGGVMNGALTGGMVAGMPGAVAGGIASGVAQAVSSGMATSVALTNDQSLCDLNIRHSNAKFRSARDNMMALVNAQIAYNSGVKNADNTYMNSTVSRFSGANGINNANAARNYDTARANAQRDYATRAAEIDNQINQARLDAPIAFGNFENGADAVTKPLGIFSNVVTQSDYAIAAAGDEFLRYGYNYGKQWKFTNWNIGKYFTYWKLKDFSVVNLDIPDLYADKLRFFLLGGVTVWNNPDYIGKVSIYDNMYPDSWDDPDAPIVPDEGEDSEDMSSADVEAIKLQLDELQRQVYDVKEAITGEHISADITDISRDSMKDRVDYIDSRVKRLDNFRANLQSFDE